MTELQEPLTQVRLDVAEMKGMLTQALGDHGQRITQLEADSRVIHGRLSDKGKLLGVHTEQIKGLQEAVHELEEKRVGTLGRVGITIGACTGVAGTLLAIFNALRI